MLKSGLNIAHFRQHVSIIEKKQKTTLEVGEKVERVSAIFWFLVCPNMSAFCD